MMTAASAGGDDDERGCEPWKIVDTPGWLNAYFSIAVFQMVVFIVGFVIVFWKNKEREKPRFVKVCWGLALIN